MSYDLMVFEPAAVPANHPDFLDWYSRQTKWSADHGYNDPGLASEHLRAWFEEIIRIFPPMNGTPVAPSPREEEASSSDYAIGSDFIYASFAYSKAEAAYMTVARLAEKYNLGLFNASSTGEEVWVPEDGRMALAHDKSPPSLVGRIKEFLAFDQ
jgi:hypothetical protein